LKEIRKESNFPAFSKVLQANNKILTIILGLNLHIHIIWNGSIAGRGYPGKLPEK
jgi:hypothetical protein